MRKIHYVLFVYCLLFSITGTSKCYICSLKEGHVLTNVCICARVCVRVRVYVMPYNVENT